MTGVVWYKTGDFFLEDWWQLPLFLFCLFHKFLQDIHSYPFAEGSLLIKFLNATLQYSFSLSRQRTGGLASAVLTAKQRQPPFGGGTTRWGAISLPSGGRKSLKHCHLVTVSYTTLSHCHLAAGAQSSHSHCIWDGIFKLWRSLGIDSKDSIPPAYVAWRAGTTTLFLFGS